MGTERKRRLLGGRYVQVEIKRLSELERDQRVQAT